jgi:hypothetical protein
MTKFDCGHDEPDDMEVDKIVVAGGWCAPSEVMYDLQQPTSCSDCRTRMACILGIGIDPGRFGENLRFKRGGIKFGDADAD